MQIGYLAGGITMGQLLSLPMLAFGIFLVMRAPAPARGAGVSALEDRLRRLILDHGPISVARYMALAWRTPPRATIRAAIPWAPPGISSPRRR